MAAQRALAELERLPAPEFTWPEVLGLRANGLDALGRHDEADALLAQAQEQDPMFWAERLYPFRYTTAQIPELDVARVLAQPRPPVESLVTIAAKDAAAYNWERALPVTLRALDDYDQPLGANVVLARMAFARGFSKEGFLFAQREIALLAGRLVREEALTPLLVELSVGQERGNRAFEQELLRTLRAAQAVPAMRYDAAQMQAKVLLRGGHMRRAAEVCLTYELKSEAYGLVYPAVAEVIMQMKPLRLTAYKAESKCKKLFGLPLAPKVPSYFGTPPSQLGTLAVLPPFLLTEHVLPRLDEVSLIHFGHASRTTGALGRVAAASMAHRSVKILLQGAARAVERPLAGASATAAAEGVRLGLSLLARAQPIALCDEVYALLRKEQSERALARLIPRLASCDDDAELFALHALVLRRLGRADEAHAAERRGAAVDDTKTQALVARMLAKGGIEDDAVRCLRAVMDRPNDAALLQAAAAAQNTFFGLQPHAERLSRRSLQLDDAQLGANGVLACFYAKQGLYPECFAHVIRETELQLAQWRENMLLSKAWLLLADATLDAKLTEQALCYLQGLITRNEADVQPYNLRIRIFESNDRLEDALCELERLARKQNQSTKSGRRAKELSAKMGSWQRRKFYAQQKVGGWL